jgi:Holliday junction resolvasome RuvABC endonuclease subunit
MRDKATWFKFTPADWLTGTAGLTFEQKGLYMIDAAIEMGIDVADEHQADALAVALCAYEHVGIAVRGHDGPLLSQLSRW